MTQDLGFTNANDASSARGDTVSSIFNALSALMLHTDYDKISVRDVTREACVSRSTFYRYFTSIDDCLEALEDKYLDAMHDINRIGLLTGIEQGSCGLTPTLVMRLEVLQRDATTALALLGPHANPRFKEKEVALMGAYFRSKIKESKLSAEETDLYLSFVINGHNGVIRRWLAEYPDLDAKVVAGLLNRLFYAALLKPEQKGGLGQI